TLVPHLLSMTATPIPRTLALTIYGDLDISIIKEKPKNRQKIITKIVTPTQRREAYQFIRSQVKEGRQVFVVCPRIELSDPKEEIKTKGNRQSKMNVLWADVKAVQEEYKKLSEEVFPDLKVAMLHGKMKPKEKQEIMTRFKSGLAHILVSTSVIEVGVDIPNATIMMIENSERFGLAQLHQFRGRIGRGEHQSYCLLFSSSAEKNINQRLKALVDTDDGFVLAEKDMAIRGPGEFIGSKQSGLPDLAMASLANVELIKKARAEARTLLKEDPNLIQYPLLKQQLERFEKMTHFE
ncbi:DNA helicase RecG, partial [Candidatus Parcubacteria bacterium]|nr:DNA helicase RecG [Candidatus Parcubacteria bacterium]